MFAFALDILLAVLAIYMLVKGHFGVTRQAALVPLAVALLDGSSVLQFDPSITPVLSAVMVALQVVILACGALMAYRDAACARQKRARRQRRRQVAASRAAFEQALEQKNRQVAAGWRRVCA